jgi:hypothetical protein
MAISACQPGAALPTASSTPTSEATEVPTQPPPTATNTAIPLPEPSQRPFRPLLLAHVMPWYQTPEISGYWGWHWTMNHFDPEQVDEDGRREIASHYYPLTGPYDSSDEHLLEYQVMLMKLSGIDGVIVDWYGIEDFWDYGVINNATRSLFEHTRNAGLLFAICYEDVTIKHMIENGHLPADQKISHAQEVMLHLQESYFVDETYLKVGDRPVLLVFGNPPYFSTSSQWEDIFSVLDTTPVFLTEDKQIAPAAVSSYPWPPMGLAAGGELSQQNLDFYLDSFNQKARDFEYWIAGAFPGFNDIYQEAGVGPGYGALDARDGETFRHTLTKALEGNPDAIQLITWNDLGEGTQIEPTEEDGYRYLEILQDLRRQNIDPAFAFQSEDLALPLQIFQLRKLHQGDEAINATLDEAVALILAGNPEQARAILDPFEP